MLPNYFFASDSEENLKSPTEARDEASLLPGSSKEASIPEVQLEQTDRGDSSSIEIKGSVIHYLLHEDEQDFKVRVTRTQV